MATQNDAIRPQVCERGQFPRLGVRPHGRRVGAQVGGFGILRTDARRMRIRNTETRRAQIFVNFVNGRKVVHKNQVFLCICPKRRSLRNENMFRLPVLRARPFFRMVFFPLYGNLRKTPEALNFKKYPESKSDAGKRTRKQGGRNDGKRMTGIHLRRGAQSPSSVPRGTVQNGKIRFEHGAGRVRLNPRHQFRPYRL